MNDDEIKVTDDVGADDCEINMIVSDAEVELEKLIKELSEGLD